jgi:hypothetical protein
MNKLQELSTTATDAPTLAGLIDSGNIADAENHARTQELLDEVLSRMPKTAQTAVPMYIGGAKLSREYYNLFVIGAEKFDKGVFQIDKNHSLVEYIDPKVKKKFFNIRDNAVVEEILTLPSLFMAENADYGRDRPAYSQYACS